MSVETADRNLPSKPTILARDRRRYVGWWVGWLFADVQRDFVI